MRTIRRAHILLTFLTDARVRGKCGRFVVPTAPMAEAIVVRLSDGARP